MDIGLIPVTFLHITMVEYTFSSQGSLNKLFQGVWEEKIFKIVIKDIYYIHIKIICIILIQSCHHIPVQVYLHTLFYVSIFPLLSYLYTLWSCTTSLYTTLRLFTSSTTQCSSLIHFTKPASSQFTLSVLKEVDWTQEE